MEKNQDNVLLDGYIDTYLNAIKFVEELVSQPTSKYNLSFEQFLIMRNIAHSEKLTLNDIAKQRNVTRSAISRQIKVLLRLNYIFQEPDSNDRRRLYLHLTAAGRKTEEIVDGDIVERFDGWVEKLGEDKATQLLSLMREFSSKIMEN